MSDVVRFAIAFVCITLALACTVAMLYGIFWAHGDLRTLTMDGGGLGGGLFLWIGKKTLPK